MPNLKIAISRNDLAEVKRLLKRYPNNIVNSFTHHTKQLKPFHYVCIEWGETEDDIISIMKLLIEHGADIHAVTKTGQTALHMSAIFANCNVCLFLVSLGLDPHATDYAGGTAFSLYGEYYFSQTDDREIFLEKDTLKIDTLKIMAARETYVRNKHWEKNWPLMCALTGSGLRPMDATMSLLAAKQAASDHTVKLDGIPRGTRAQNLAYLNQAIFGRENEHAILRRIVEFLPLVTL
jgi:hypothetical protein